MRKAYWVLIIIVIVLAINEFVVFPILPGSASSTSASCAGTSLSDLTERSEIILTGTAGDFKWVTREREISAQLEQPPPGQPRAEPITRKTRKVEEIFTDTEINIDQVIKGDYDDDEITVSQFGGCNIRLNYCVYTSVSSEFDEGNKYLLFLSDPNEDGVYGGFSDCGGKYTITLDDSGNEVVKCFDQNNENCIETEVSCPPREQFRYTVQVNEEGNPIPQPERKCYQYHMLVSDLIEQIQTL